MKLDYLEKIVIYPTYCEVHLGDKFHKNGTVTIQAISYFQYRILLEYVRNLIKEIIDIPSQEVRKALFFEDHCVQCGECCRQRSYVMLTTREAKAISEYLGIDINEFTEKGFLWNSDYMIFKRKMKNSLPISCCTFLQEQSDGLTNCKIYPVRPQTCQDYKLLKGKLCKITKEHIRNILEIRLFLSSLEIVTIRSNKKEVSNPIIQYRLYPTVARWVQKILEELRSIELPKDIIFTEQSGLECAQCGWCCFFKGEALVSNDDIDHLAKFLNISNQEFTDKYTHTEITWDKEARALNRIGVLLFEGSSHCVFLEQGKDKLFYCSVNSAKPQICRDYEAGFYCGSRQNWLPC